MKKIIAAILLCGLLSVFMVACTSSDEPAEEENNAYDIGETWTVEGNWAFTVNSVKTDDERDESYNKTYDIDPAQVIVINYTYENLGYKNEGEGMEGLYIDLPACTLVDAGGNICDVYPIKANKYAEETPVGAKCTAQYAFALLDEGKTATLTVEAMNNDRDVESATFNLSWK